MKKLNAFLLSLALVTVLLTGCGARKTEFGTDDTSVTVMHRIGVSTYNIKDAEVLMFRNYLEDYIANCFEDVEFLYSESLTDADQNMAFLQTCADQGCEAVMCFNSYDLRSEVEFCAAHNMYYICPASHSATEEFNSVADNPWFIGEIGPDADEETKSCTDMVNAMAKQGDGQSFIVLSGGAFMGVEMHRLRTVAVLSTLQEVYGVTFEKSVEELAVVSQPTEVAANGLNIIICPGFVEMSQYAQAASEAILSGKYTTVLSVIAVTPLMDSLTQVKISCGVTDCFSEDNYFGFKKNKISYVAGKYESEIGPAFAAVYNAITGNAEILRQDGKAFSLNQGYWTAADSTTFDSMYALSSGISINAYSAEDLFSVIKVYSDDASFETFKALVESYTYEDAIARRSM